MGKHKAGEYCNKRARNVELQLVLLESGINLITNCPCCGQSVQFSWPDKDRKKELTKNNRIFSDTNCSQCGWVWADLSPIDVQNIADGKLVPMINMRLVAGTLAVQNSP